MTPKVLPPGLGAKLKELVSMLEQREIVERPVTGSFELKINNDEALWFVAYKTAAETVTIDPLGDK
jgi:hypothetical protein